jgi:hypothetical protein
MVSRVRAPILLKVLFVLFSVLLLTPALALAANDTPNNPVTLSVSNSSASDTLVGSTGGAYRFYQFSYQGGNAPVLVTLNYQPAYGGGNQAFGFNIYGPNSLSYAGHVTGTNGNAATAQYTVVASSAMTLLVQVYNYTAGGPVSFTLTISGLSGGSTTTVAPKDNTTPNQAQPIQTINATIGGSIDGNAGGAFQYYTLNYPGGNTAMTVTMNASPTYNGQGTAYGFNLYRHDKNGNSVLAATSGVASQDSSSMTLTATVTNTAAMTYQLQVFNYWPGVTIHYGVNMTGLAAPATPATGNTDAGHAVVLNSGHQGATQTLVGNSGGANQYYLVNYPGNNSTLSVSVTFTSMAGVSPSAVGFNVYDGSTLKATARPVDDGHGIQAAIWTYTDPNPATFGIQVFNYAPGATVSYTIYQVGSQ